MLSTSASRRARRATVAGALWSLALVAPALAAPPKRVAELLPADTLLVVGVDDLAAYRTAVEGMPLTKILAEEEVRTFLEKPKQVITESLESLRSMVQQESGFEDFELSLDDLKNGDYGRIFFAITHFGMPDAQAGEEVPDLGILLGIEPRQGAPDIQALLKDLIARVAANQGMDGLSFAPLEGEKGIEALQLPGGGAPPVPLLFGRAGDLQLISTSMKTMREAMQRANGGDAPSLAKADGYATAQKHLAVDDAGAVRVFADLERLVRLSAELIKVGLAQEGMTEQIAVVDDVVEKLGLLQLGATAAVSVPRDGVALGRSWTQVRGEPKGLLAAFCGDPIDLSKLSAVPRDAASFVLTKFDVAKFYDTILETVAAVDPSVEEQARMMMQQFGAQIGTPDEPFDLRSDLLANLGPGLMVVEPPAANPTAPSLLLSLEVREPERVTKALQQLIGFGAQMAGASKVNVGSIDYEGTTLHPIEGATPSVGAMISPSYAVVGDTLHVSLNLADLKRLVRRKAADGEDIRANESFQRFYREVPEGTELGSLSYTDVRYKFESGYSQIVQLLPLLSMMVDFELPFQPELLPTQESIAQHLFPSLNYSMRRGEGFLTESRGPIGGEVIGVVAAAAAGGAVYAALLGAQEVKVSRSGGPTPPPRPVESSPDEVVRRDLNELKAGITIYKLQHGAVPQRLEQLLEPSADYPDGYLAASQLPVDPWGRPYRYERTGDAAYMVWSVGPNGEDERGEGDDVSYVRR